MYFHGISLDYKDEDYEDGDYLGCKKMHPFSMEKTG
jgi:hypothetical protein